MYATDLKHKPHIARINEHYLLHIFQTNTQLRLLAKARPQTCPALLCTPLKGPAAAGGGQNGSG